MAKPEEKAAYEHHGATIQTVVTPLTCARCHQTEVAQQQRSHHAKAGNILASIDKKIKYQCCPPLGHWFQ